MHGDKVRNVRENEKLSLLRNYEIIPTQSELLKEAKQNASK